MLSLLQDLGNEEWDLLSVMLTGIMLGLRVISGCVTGNFVC